VEATHSHEVVYFYPGKLRLRCPGDRPTVGLMEHKRRLFDVSCFWCFWFRFVPVACRILQDGHVGGWTERTGGAMFHPSIHLPTTSHTHTHKTHTHTHR
jgi:hypothetical protein